MPLSTTSAPLVLSRRSTTNGLCNSDDYDHLFGHFPGPSVQAVLLTIAIVLLSIAVSVAAHTGWDATTETQTMTPETQTSTPIPRFKLDSTSPARHPTNSPSPALRARRLVRATIFMVPLCVAFGFRISDVVCAEVLNFPQLPPWWAVVVVSMMPFSLACIEFLRALLDCVLVRCGRALSRTYGPLYWPVLAPLSLVVDVLMLGAACVTQRPVAEVWGEGVGVGVGVGDRLAGEDVEMGEGVEEEARLMDDVEGQYNEEEHGDGPPAYDSVGTKNGGMV